MSKRTLLLAALVLIGSLSYVKAGGDCCKKEGGCGSCGDKAPTTQKS